MIKIEGQYGVSATVLKDSISPQGIRFITFEVTYWRGVLAELNTHRALSKASASSRAIPFEKMAQNLTGRPHRFGQANPGMQDKGEDYCAPVGRWIGPDYFGENHFIGYGDYPGYPPEAAWASAQRRALEASEAFYKAGYHKQVYNRLTEPFQMMKTVISGTEWGNFLWLRDHEAADPSLAELARCIREAGQASTPVLLHPGEWALPYVEQVREADGEMVYWISHQDGDTLEYTGLTLEEAKAVSAARCAAVSFRNVDYGLEKSEQVFTKLVGDDRKHASAFEHQGTPMAAQKYTFEDRRATFLNFREYPQQWEEGITHCDRQGALWSGNLRGWVQHRKLISGENFVGGF